jgi:hypothetical protein
MEKIHLSITIHTLHTIAEQVVLGVEEIGLTVMGK